jgi:hypothetical protein
VSEIEAGDIDVHANPKVVAESDSTAKVDGMNALGAVVSTFALDVAIAKAKATGVGVVCAGHSNHYGIAGYYALKVSKIHPTTNWVSAQLTCRVFAFLCPLGFVGLLNHPSEASVHSWEEKQQNYQQTTNNK